MEIAEILSQLERLDGPFPLEAVEEARSRREEITPHLLEILRDTRARLSEVSEDERAMAPLWALYLLAEFRERRAYPLVVELFAGPREEVEKLAWDFIAQDLDRVLISVYDGDDRPIRRLVEDPEVGEWVRGAGIRTLAGLVALGLKERDDVAAYFRRLLMGPPEKPCTHFWNELVSCAADLHPGDSLEEIRRAFDLDLVDEGYVAFDEIEEEAQSSRQAVMEGLRLEFLSAPIEDAALEMEGRTKSEEDWEEAAQWQEEDEEEDWHDEPRLDPSQAEALGGTVRREGPKVGRNDSCPCGSGKKYKKCCGG
jgi:uncharacterized protein YchJ